MMVYRILSISALFPPDVIGGAETSAARLAEYWASRGHEPGVITTAKDPSEELNGVIVNGVRTWRVHMPRPYPTFLFPSAPGWQKPIWHLQDHFDPRNSRIVSRVLDEFRPDFVNVHMVQGIGYNALKEIAKRDIPTVYVLHDLGLACVRQSMFKRNADCPRQCGVCRLSSAYKSRLLHGFRRLGFSSPSRANLERLGKFFPVSARQAAVNLDPNRYPLPTEARSESATVRILFVGRLHDSKGIRLLLSVAERLAERYPFTLTVVGTGPIQAELVERYGAHDWCRFTGFINQTEISNRMINSDVLCIPSIWQENSPGVVIHALSLGLPVLGSNKGGIPELIQHGITGQLVNPGDEGAWTSAIEQVLADPALLRNWRRNASERSTQFDQDTLARGFLDFMESVAART
jgi:glycosyltransferase involved in cell wall biosynthesis